MGSGSTNRYDRKCTSSQQVFSLLLNDFKLSFILFLIFDQLNIALRSNEILKSIVLVVMFFSKGKVSEVIRMKSVNRLMRITALSRNISVQNICEVSYKVMLNMDRLR